MSSVNISQNGRGSANIQVGDLSIQVSGGFITIDGHKFSRGMLNHLATLKPGTLLRIGNGIEACISYEEIAANPCTEVAVRSDLYPEDPPPPPFCKNCFNPETACTCPSSICKGLRSLGLDYHDENCPICRRR